jgi:hypothetical protein
LAAGSEQPDSVAAALTEVTERVTALVHDEIELAKAEVADKAKSLLAGGIAIGAGAVFGIFALVIGLGTLAWGLNSLLNSIWLGFLITFAVLIGLTVGAFLLAWRKFKVGAPTPRMAIDEAKKIRTTVTTTAKPEGGR